MKMKNKCAAVRLEKSRLLAAMAVLAVAFAAFAVMTPIADNADGSTPVGTETIYTGDGNTGYSVTFYKKAQAGQTPSEFSGLEATYDSDTKTFKFNGYVVAGQDASGKTMPGATQWAKMTFSGLPQISEDVDDNAITEKNPSFGEQCGDGKIREINTNYGTDGKYRFAIPRAGDGEQATVQLTIEDGTYSFDFSEVSTKFILAGDAVKFTGIFADKIGYSVSENTKTLTLTGYTGKDIFYSASALGVVFSGSNTVRAYGSADSGTANGSAAIFCGSDMSVGASAKDSSLGFVLGNGIFGLWAQNITIGNAEDTCTTVYGSEGGNRAIYAGTVKIQNADIDIEASEKAIRTTTGGVTVVASTVVAELTSNIDLNEMGEDGRFGIKTATLSVDGDSVVTTDGLQITGAGIKDVGEGLVKVSGDYTQNPDAELSKIIAGLYLSRASDITADKATPSEDSKGLYLIEGAEAYNVIVKDSSQTTEKTEIDTDAAKTEAEKTEAGTSVVSEVKTGSDATKDNISDAIVEATKQIATVTSESTGNVSVEIIVPIADEETELEMTSTAIAAIKGSGAQLTISSGAATVSLDNDVVKELSTQATSGNKDVKISVVVNSDTITEAQKAVVGTSSTVDVSAHVGETSVSKLNGTATISVPYETEGQVKVTYVRDDGTTEPVDSTYADGTVTFQTTHFSKYMLTELKDDSEMETVSIEGTVKGTGNQYDAGQLVRIAGNTVMAEGSKLVINGKLYIPAGVTLTMEAGAKLILQDGATLEIDGTLVVKDTDGENGDAKVTVMNGSVSVSGILDLKGDLGVTAGDVTVEADGVMTIEETGMFTSASTGTSLTVEASGTMYVIGSLGAMTVIDNGSIVFDSEVASGDVTIYLTNGASVDIISIAMKQGGKLTVQDGSSAATADVKNKIEVTAATASGTKADDANDSAYVEAVIEGIEISETTTSTTAFGTTTYTYKMYINGDASVSAAYVTDGSENEPTNMKAVATITATGAEDNGVFVSEDLTVGEDVTLDNKGVLEVSADVDATEGAITQTSGSITVTGEGSIVLKAKIASETGVSATKYATGSSDSARVTYVTLDAALAIANAGTSTDLTVLGTQTLYASATVPADVKLTLTDATVAIGEDADDTNVTLTVEDGASVKGTPTKVTVNGTIYAVDKTDVDTAARTAFYTGSSVYTEELNEKGQAVRTGWAKWTNITAALADAEDYSVVKITKAIEIETNTTIPETVTLDTNTFKVSVKAGATLTVNGTLYLNNGSGDSTLTLNKKTTSGTDTYGAIVLNGDIESDKDVSGMVKKGEFSYVIPGAYYSVTASGTTKYYATTVAQAAPVISLVDEQTVTLRGAELTVGDVVFAGLSSTETATVNVEADKLTAASITLGNAKLDLKKAQFEGTVKDADGSVALKGTSGSLTATSTDKFTLAGEFTVGTSGKFEVSGTAYTSGLTATPVKVSGTLYLGGVNAITSVEVTGTLAVQKDASLTSDDVTVTGTLSVADDASTVTIKELFVGIDKESALVDSTGASAAVSGKVTLTGYAIVAPGSTVPELSKKTTAFYIGSTLYLTGYAGTTDGNIAYIADIDAHITDARFDGWYNEAGKKAVSGGSASGTAQAKIGADGWSKATASVTYEIYTIQVMADEGIANVYIDGNLMAYGMYGDTGGYAYFYMDIVKAGAHTITYNLKNGFSGEAKLTLRDSGDCTASVSGSSVTVNGEEGTVILQLTGIEKSGYVDPVEPQKEDNSLKVTDYLLIVLVILVVVLAVIVALRLMRS